MNLSLGEMRALALKATKGAGYEWGEAEEVAEALVWLERRGLMGAEALIVFLDANCAEDEARSPLVLGLALSEGRLKVENAELVSIHAPALLLPFLHRFAVEYDLSLDIRMDNARVRMDARGLQLDGELSNQADVKISMLSERELPDQTLQDRIEVKKEIYEQLAKHAEHIYAPATESSRLLGAGAGNAADND